MALALLPDRSLAARSALVQTSARAGAIAFHHQPRATPGDMGDHGGTAVELGNGAEIDGESQDDLLALAQAEVGGFDEHPGSAEIDRLTKLAAAPWNHNVDDRPSAVPCMQAT